MYRNPDTKAYTKEKGNKAVSGGFIALLVEKPLAVSSLWAGIFLVLFSGSWMLGIVPKLDVEDEAVDAAVVDATPVVQEDGTPARIVIDAIDVDAPIENPKSASIEVLDEALLSGVVHYPGSGNLDEHTNLFLFGHSTGFRVVQNEMFKVFNGLKNLEENDLIRVQSATHEYVYRVTKVTLTTAEEAKVELSTREKKLTLSTCNSFGDTQERYVVEADFVGSYPLKTAYGGELDF